MNKYDKFKSTKTILGNGGIILSILKYRYSLKFRLLLTILIITIAPIIILGSLSYKKSHELLTKQSNEDMQNITNQINNSLDEYFLGLSNIVSIASNQEALATIVQREESDDFIEIAKSNKDALYTDDIITLNTINQMREQISHIKEHADVKTCYIATRNCNMYSDEAQYVMGIDGDFNCTEREWYKKAIQNSNEVIWIPPYVDRNNDMVVITLAKAIKKNNEILGVFALDINLDNMIKKLKTINLGSTGNVFVLDSNGEYLIHEDDNLLGSVIKDKDILNILQNNSFGQYNNDNRMNSFVTNNITGWKIVASIDKSILYSKANSIRKFTIYMSFLFTVLILIAGIIYSKSLTSSIESIISHLNHITSGDFSVSLPSKLLNRKDEIGKVSESINSMRNNIKILVEGIQSLNDEIFDTQKEIVYKLGEIAETRSQETGNHVRRVATYSELIAEKLGMPSNEIKVFKLASTLHDIGKIGIPDSILLKPGKLNDNEFGIMKTHTLLGYEILKGSSREILKSAAIIALEHHEKYDGSGYPKGLKGDEIHIYGRIVAIADVFDALSTDRVYKKAWDLDEVIQYIKDQRGIQFDPSIVDIFINNIDDILAIKDRLSNDIKALKAI